MSVDGRAGMRLKLYIFILLISQEAVQISPINAAQGLAIIPKPFEIPEFGTVTGFLVTLGKHKISFIPPPRWHVETDSKALKVTCLAPDLGASLSFRLIAPNPVTMEKGQLTEELLKAYITTTYPKATITRTFLSFTNGTQGLTFDLQMLAQGKFLVTYRLAYIPLGKDLIEFNLTSSSSRFESFHNSYGYLMSSFKVEGSTDPSVKLLEP